MTRRALLAALAAGAVLAAAPLPGAAPARADIVRDRQWHLDDLRLPAAWKISRGKGVTIAILDTGVDPRSENLRGRVKTGPDYVKSGAKRGDADWGRHGTDMATVAAGGGPRSGAPNGVLGVAPEARILSVRVIAEDEDPKGDSGPSDGVARAIRYAADHGAGVINMSFGRRSRRPPRRSERDERAAVRYALSKGVVVVASAGNDGDPNDRKQRGRNYVDFPAGYAGVIAVAAAGRRHTAAAFSTRHSYVTLAAPGVDIIDRADFRKYYFGSGTSQASAVVSGTVALIKAKYPKLSPAQIRQLLIDTATNRPAGGFGGAVGFGSVNPLGALRRAAQVSRKADGPRQAEAAVRPAGMEYFGSGPPRPVAAAAAAPPGLFEGRKGRRVLLGGLGVVLLLPSPFLLIGGARRVRAARRARREAAAATPVPDNDRDQRQQLDVGELPVLEHEHQRHHGQDEHLPPLEGSTAPDP